MITFSSIIEYNIPSSPLICLENTIHCFQYHSQFTYSFCYIFLNQGFHFLPIFYCRRLLFTHTFAFTKYIYLQELAANENFALTKDFLKFFWILFSQRVEIAQDWRIRQKTIGGWYQNIKKLTLKMLVILPKNYHMLSK